MEDPQRALQEAYDQGIRDASRTSTPVMSAPGMVVLTDEQFKALISKGNGANGSSSVRRIDWDKWETFDGEEAKARGWMDRTDNAVVEDFGPDVGEREIRRVATRLRGRAWTWYSDLVRNSNAFPFANWDAFRKLFFEEFEVYDPNTNYRDKLLNLKQTRSVVDYNKEFRELVCRIDGQSEADRIAMYKHGLKAKTRYEVNYYAPKTLSEAMRVARLYDETMYKKEGQSEARQRNGPRNFEKGLSKSDDPMELDVICYKCKKKGHYQRDCKWRKPFNKLNNVESLSVETNTASSKIVELNSMSESKSNRYELIRLNGKLNGKEVKCLVDSGATHNFVRKDVIGNLKLSLKTDGSDEVKLANGNSMAAIGRLENVKLMLNNTYECVENFIVLDSCSSDVILGREWLFHHKPNIDWQTGKVKIIETEMYAENDSETENPIECQTISGQQAKRLIRKPSSKVFLAFLKVLDYDGEKEAANSKTDIDAELEQILEEFADVFPKKITQLPPKRLVEHHILLKDDEPVYRGCYRLSPLELRTLKDQLKEMLEAGLIQPCASPYGAPVLFVKKADGSLRMVIDFRALNKKVIRDRFPMPLIADLLDKVGAAKYFSKLDLMNGFYQVRIADDSRGKTIINTPLGQFELLVMPMGQANSTATMQRLMDSILGDVKGVLYYLDDLLIFAPSMKEHNKILRQVLERLRKEKLYCKFEKCEFGKARIVWVGHQMAEGVRGIDPAKAKFIRAFPVPKNVTELRSFIGIINYCRDFLPKLSEVLAPLTELTKKAVSFNWREEHQVAFENAKDLVGESIELTVYEEGRPTKLQTDASLIGLGAVLLQKIEEKWMPVAVASRKLIEAEKNYPTHEREMLAIVWAVKQFRHYLEGIPFDVETDHHALRYVLSQPILSRRMARWVEELGNFDIQVEYLSGKKNNLADLLSRTECNSAHAYLTEPLAWSGWPNLVIEAKLGNWGAIPEDCRDFIGKELENFEWDNERGILYRKNPESADRVPFVPFESRADLVQRWHVGDGHLSARQLVDRLRSRAWWPGMNRDIMDWVRRCPECQLLSNDVRVPHEVAHAIEPHPEVFGRWYIDWIGPLPESSNGNRFIWTAIEETTRWPIAVPVQEATAEVAGKLLYENVVVNFGVPSEIITDRGRNFLARSLQEYLRIVGVKHRKTSAYHPRTNGKVENFNGTLGRLLAKCVQSARHKWDQFIPEALFNIRVRTHSILNKSPFELVYGVQPKIPGDTVQPFVLKQSDPRDNAEIRARLLEQVGDFRAAAMARSKLSSDQIKLRYDKLVKEDPLVEGEWVLMRRESRYKLQSKWVGPFKVAVKGPSGIYQLQYPDGHIKDDWVHRDRLKRAVVDPQNPPTELWTDDVLEALDPVFGQGGNDMDWIPDAANTASST